MLQVNKPVKVQWDNELVDSRGNFIPHLLAGAIDQTLHWCVLHLVVNVQCKEGMHRQQQLFFSLYRYTGSIHACDLHDHMRTGVTATTASVERWI